jgi:hypothetical protein
VASLAAVVRRLAAKGSVQGQEFAGEVEAAAQSAFFSLGDPVFGTTGAYLGA